MTNTTTRRKFERAFTGNANRALRAKIREAVSGHRCGPANRRAVLSLASVVALNAIGRNTLAAVAADYEAAGGPTKATCDCADCYETNLAGVRATLGQ